MSSSRLRAGLVWFSWAAIFTKLGQDQTLTFCGQMTGVLTHNILSQDDLSLSHLKVDQFESSQWGACLIGQTVGLLIMSVSSWQIVFKNEAVMSLTFLDLKVVFLRFSHERAYKGWPIVQSLSRWERVSTSLSKSSGEVDLRDDWPRHC